MKSLSDKIHEILMSVEIPTYQEMIESGQIIPMSEPLPPWNKGKTGLQISPWKGKRRQYSESALNAMRTKSHPPGSQEKHSNTIKGSGNPAYGCRWMHDNKGNHKRIKYSEIHNYIAQGWVEGRLKNRSKETGQFIKGLINGNNYSN